MRTSREDVSFTGVGSTGRLQHTPTYAWVAENFVGERSLAFRVTFLAPATICLIFIILYFFKLNENLEVGAFCESIMSLVQYVILRKDLQTVLNWPLGALFAQTCHATTAVLHMFQDDPNTKNYFGDLDSMHKVVLQAPDLEALTNLITKLTEHKIDHKAWVEQPENVLTCIALKPYPKNEVKGFVQQFKLYN